MKTPLMYGALMAVIGALATYGLFFAGFHDTPEKLKVAQWIGLVVGLLGSVVCMALAMRERRAEFPPERRWSYGSALGVGFMTGVWATLFGAVSAYVYFAIINPQFSDVVFQSQVAKWQEMGMNASQIEAASGFTRKFLSPVPMTIFQAISGVVAATILSLIVAIFFRSREVVPDPAAAEAPPPLA